MTLHRFIRKILKLSFLKVNWIKFKDRNRELQELSPTKMGVCVPTVAVVVRY